MQLNLIVHSVKGLGRGRGFAVTSIKSIIADPEFLVVRKQLAARILEVLGLLVRDGTTSNNHILQQLGIVDDTKAKLVKMEDDTKARLANVEGVKGIQSSTIRVLMKELEESMAKIALMEEENRNLMAKLSSIEDERKEIEAKYDTMESEIDHLLLIAGLRPSQYLDLDSRLEALGDELLALRAYRE